MHVVMQLLKLFNKPFERTWPLTQQPSKYLWMLLVRLQKKSRILLSKNVVIGWSSSKYHDSEAALWYSKHMFSKSKFANCKYMKLQDSRSLYLREFSIHMINFSSVTNFRKARSPQSHSFQKGWECPSTVQFIVILTFYSNMWSIQSCCLSSGNYPHCTVTNDDCVSTILQPQGCH